MLCNRLVSKRIGLSLIVLLFFSFWLGIIPDAQAKGVCIKEDYSGVLQCEMKETDDECAAFSGQYSESFKSCDEYAQSAQGGSSASGQVPKVPKGGLDALKSSVDTLTKTGGVTKSLEQVIGGYIKTALVLVGTLFMALTFYGGYIWFIAREDEEEAKRARSIISMALIGLIIVLSAYFVTYFIIYRLTVASGTGLLK